ncbi:hypothetical protein [Flavobacterium haoranii]|uniref:Uncharacterized protein n=1 Tax=Flavobacterium haoranii TaxID=683124 RepID=A0A1M6EUN7_9FLAO|nr:hypothetical protein [Flavobacterium haoranii]SHI89142.1 hypothetical protein SAMN05444337_1042 [Flavobacterium haoranii]
MKITPEQIERLYQFTRQHYVEWYDLQTELVDHLANAIEQQWYENPNVHFEEALQIEFKKFGVFGFMDVVEKRQAALNKKYNKIIWGHFKDFFSVPKIIITFSLIGSLFLMLKNFKYAELISTTLIFGVIITFWIGLLIQKRKSKKQTKESGKKWLLKDIIFGYSTFAGLSYLPLQLIINVDFENIGNLKALVISSITIFLYLIEYIMLFEIPSKAGKYLEETYPEYNFVT